MLKPRFISLFGKVNGLHNHNRFVDIRNFSVGKQLNSQTKTAILMLNMGGPQTVDQVHDYLLRIMTDRDMIQLPFQKFSGTSLYLYMLGGIVVSEISGKPRNKCVLPGSNPSEEKKKSLKEFLYQLLNFSQEMIIREEKFAEQFLGPFIAKKRTPDVQKKYNEIGGGSPILKWTELQGNLLCKKLDQLSPQTAPHKPYIAFRYAHPLTEKTLEDIERDGVKRVVIFSQYPQYSCSTTGSSFNAIYSYYKNKNQFPNDIEWSVIDRWSTHSLLVKTFVTKIKEELKHFSDDIRKDVVILFSAHSLPLRVVSRGDSYPSEVGATVHLVMEELKHSNPYALVWQSKVGPVPWLKPFTDEAIEGYVKQGKKNFLLVPIAFVNEHIETLHELDIEYCVDLKKKIGFDTIRRVQAPNDHPIFIDALADIVTTHMKSKKKITPKFLVKCPHCTNEKCHSAKEWFAQLCA